MRPLPLLVVGLLLPLAGCADDRAPPPSISPITAGDAWSYDVMLESGGTLREDVHVLPNVELPWGDGMLALHRVVTSNDGPGSWPVIEFRPDAGHAVAQLVAREEGRHTEDYWEEPCLVLPAALDTAHVERAECLLRGHLLDPSGETLMLMLVRLTTVFTVGPVQSIEVPAGRFRAVPIQVDYDADAGDGYFGITSRTLWYSVEACAIVREDGITYVRELVAFRCAATARSAGVPPPPPDPTTADAAAARWGPDAAYRTCPLRPIHVGVGDVGTDDLDMDPFTDHCDRRESVGGMDLRWAQAVQVEATWNETAAVQVHLDAGGQTASGAQSPLRLELPSSQIDDTFQAKIRMDGHSGGDRFTLTFRILPEPMGPGRPF